MTISSYKKNIPKKWSIKTEHILLPRTGRTKKIWTVEERKKANINYCTKYRQKNKEAHRKAERERKKLARENLKVFTANKKQTLIG